MSANVCSKAIRLSWSDGETSMCAVSASIRGKVRGLCVFTSTQYREVYLNTFGKKRYTLDRQIIS